MNSVSQFGPFVSLLNPWSRQNNQTKLECFILVCILCNIVVTESKVISWSKAPQWDPENQNELCRGLTIHLEDVRTSGTERRTDGMRLMNLSCYRRVWKSHSTCSKNTVGKYAYILQVMFSIHISMVSGTCGVLGQSTFCQTRTPKCVHDSRLPKT